MTEIGPPLSADRRIACQQRRATFSGTGHDDGVLVLLVLGSEGELVTCARRAPVDHNELKLAC